jgi:hypothetical protein
MAAAVVLAADWEKWTAIGTLAAAGATLVLAAVTVWLVFTTRRVVSETAEQLAIERGRIEASQRPYVFPAPSADWIRNSGPYSGGHKAELFPVTNAGPGPALNVGGQLQWGPPSGVTVNLVSTRCEQRMASWAARSRQAGFREARDGT